MLVAGDRLQAFEVLASVVIAPDGGVEPLTLVEGLVGELPEGQVDAEVTAELLRAGRSRLRRTSPPT